MKKGVTLSDSHDVPKKTPLINDDLWWSPFKGIFPRHLMEKVGEEKVGDLVPRLYHHMKKKHPKNNAFAKPTSAWEFEFLVHIYKAKWHIIIALFFLEKTNMLFSCFTAPAKQASIQW